MDKPSSILAKLDDGTIQLTFNIPNTLIKKNREEVVEEIGKIIEIPGFRKGKAPLEKVIEKIPQNELIQKTLSRVLPKLFADAISEYKLKPAIYPRFELIKAEENEDWQVRAVTCDIPEVELGDYKAAITSLKTSKIWTPNSSEPTRNVSQSDAAGEKEQQVLKSLIENVKVNIPKILIDQEVDTRLANLLERIEKLGLTLDNYLASIGKNPESLRKEYGDSVRESISVELILDKIAQAENVEAKQEEIEKAINTLSADPNTKKDIDNPTQRRLIEAILKRRKVLEILTSL
ncbi:hypothetical protein A3D00_04140 [Candidatus Woesebacteria bacterium RIFCSPHIGHO2_02_FULL_38_9]|uniref:Trigger factor n=1 Tax=Candidatus Woesebacteria bacterium RIFCSPHIGHO2_01_FULL_39_28 TaxID=1802496 RepID=A0A1F7YCK6_9BACT|nr:MAG: hypothetical protein A2627_05145 [Candidatus Woesebacteria bacterium RIFCSPHIGHO2_01_FULL_39_28]OGM33755.1 MAG: hypothetical protein A3D00_04140 [Candidatus Woesebacteria bacterium RIFCSPHIGHO2_02_FULL_38_9]OGM57578.1 MAG: hypothetical protein A3A50_06255 [Candidatus Woesebacteria bacterium RIFCSPLOWO2_01_FULL_38_20]